MSSTADSPQLWLRLGQNLAEDKIKEGDDVYFDCEASANPAVGRIEWRLNVSCSAYNCFEIKVLVVCVYKKQSPKPMILWLLSIHRMRS